jgi:acetyl esterase/lipase
MKGKNVRTICFAVILSCWFIVGPGHHGVTAQGLPKTENAKTPAKTFQGIILKPNLTYDAGKKLMLDVVYPSVGTGPFPVVIVLHGTGPMNRGHLGCVPWAKDLARKGYAAVAVSYRSKPEDTFPAAIQDVQCAIHWLRAHAADYQIDMDRLGIVGFSGGGTLACLLGMKGNGLPKIGGIQAPVGNVRAVVSFYGPTDFARFHEVCQKKAKQGNFLEKLQSEYVMKSLETWLGGPPLIVPGQYAISSPMSKDFQDSPPILLFHGSEDSFVPLEQSLFFAQKLRESGRPVKLLIVEGAGHDFEEKNKTDRRLAFAASLAFLDDHLLADGNAARLVKKAPGDQ